MARPLRVEIKNGWYHVTNRGNNRQAIYLDDRDRWHFLELLGEMVERHAVELHGYVLMGNHYHLLVRTPDANLSAAVQWLNVAYSIWWNRRHGRSGHVFQGRFKAVLVEAGPWVLACSLYLHLNPVAIQALELAKSQKAGEAKGWRKADGAMLAKRLERLRGYRWSSYGAYAGYGAAPAWLSTEELWRRAGGRAGYRKLTEERLCQGEAESLWRRLKWGLVLGGEGFAEEARERLKVHRESTERKSLRKRRSWEDVVQAVEKMRGEKWGDFANRHGDAGLGMTLYLARRCTGLTLGELGNWAGGMDYSAVAASIRRFEKRIEKDKTLGAQAKAILNGL